MNVWFYLFISTYIIGIFWTLLIAVAFDYTLKEKNILAWGYLLLWPLYTLWCIVIFIKSLRSD